EGALENLVAGPKVLGVTNIGEAGVELSIWAQAEAMSQWALGRQLRKLVKETLDAHGIKLGYPRRHVMMHPMEPSWGVVSLVRRRGEGPPWGRFSERQRWSRTRAAEWRTRYEWQRGHRGVCTVRGTTAFWAAWRREWRSISTSTPPSCGWRGCSPSCGAAPAWYCT